MEPMEMERRKFVKAAALAGAAAGLSVLGVSVPEAGASDSFHKDKVRFVHVEVAVDNPTAARDFMKNVMGAVDCDAGLESMLSDVFAIPKGDILHVMLGGVVFQLTNGWEADRAIHGNHIHNVNIMVEDVDGLVEEMTDRGCTITLDVPNFPWEPSGVRGNLDSPQRLVVVDAKEQCGLAFEMEPYMPNYTPGWTPSFQVGK